MIPSKAMLTPEELGRHTQERVHRGPMGRCWACGEAELVHHHVVASRHFETRKDTCETCGFAVLTTSPVRKNTGIPTSQVHIPRDV